MNVILGLDPRIWKFSRMHGVRIDKLIVSRQAIPLHARKTHKSEFLGHVPPYTLMAMGKDDVAAADWHPVIASNGIKGYMGDPIPLEALAQKHVCFGWTVSTRSQRFSVMATDGGLTPRPAA